MKIEPELIKSILEFCEKRLPDDEQVWQARTLEIDGFSSKQILYHASLLYEKGYIKGEPINSIVSDLSDFYFVSLTWDGHEYLNLIRGRAWNTAKGLMHEFGVIFSEAAIKAIIDKYSPIIIP